MYFFYFILLAAIRSNRENKSRVNYEFQLFRVSALYSIFVSMKTFTKAALARSVLNREHSSLFFVELNWSWINKKNRFNTNENWDNERAVAFNFIQNVKNPNWLRVHDTRNTCFGLYIQVYVIFHTHQLVVEEGFWFQASANTYVHDLVHSRCDSAYARIYTSEALQTFVQIRRFICDRLLNLIVVFLFSVTWFTFRNFVLYF